MTQVEFNFDSVESEAQKLAGQILVEINSVGFVEAMRILARRMAERNGWVTVDDLRKWALEHDVSPHHQNAWGAVFRKGFEAIGRVKSSLVSNHSRWVFQWAIKGGRTFYVSDQGDDANDGSLDRPWRSLQHATSEVIQNDNIIVVNDSEGIPAELSME